MVELSFTSQPGFTGNQIIIFPWHAKNLCRITNIHPWKLGRVLKDKCVRNQSEMALEKNKPCCHFCDINLPYILFSKLLIAPLVVTNWRSLSWKSRPHGQFKNCWTAPWKFSEWIYRRLRIISRTRSRATQESSDEIYHHFRFVNSSETFQPPLWFSRNPPREFNGQNILPERHSAFREL